MERVGCPVFTLGLHAGSGAPPVRRFLLPPRPEVEEQQQRSSDEPPPFVGFLRSDGSCELHPFKGSEGRQVLLEGGAPPPVWLDFLSLPSFPAPHTEPTSTSTTAEATTTSSTGTTGARSKAQTQVVVCLHEREGGQEVQVRAWELRHHLPPSRPPEGAPKKKQQAVRSSSNQPGPSQKRRAEWRPIEVEVEVPPSMEATMKHWRQAAEEAAAVAGGESCGAATDRQQQSAPSVVVSYLHATKGRKESEANGDPDEPKLPHGGSTGVMVLPNPKAARVATDGRHRVAIASPGVAAICLWTVSLHTALDGKSRRRQLRLTFERLLSYPGMEVTCLALLPPGAVAAGTEHGVVVHQLDKTDTTNAWSVIPLEQPSSAPISSTDKSHSITAIYLVEQPVPDEESSAMLVPFMCLDSQGSLFLVTPTEDSTTQTIIFNLAVPFPLDKHRLTVLPLSSRTESGALVFATGQASIYICRLSGILKQAKLRPRLVDSSQDEATRNELVMQLPLTRAILSDSPVLAIAASVPPYPQKVSDFLDTRLLFVSTVADVKVYVI